MFDGLMNSVNNLCVDVFKTSNEIVLSREGVELPLDAIFDRNYQSVDPDSNAQIISSKIVLSLKTIDLPGGVIQEDDRIKLDDRIYSIDDSMPDSEGMIKLFLLRSNA